MHALQLKRSLFRAFEQFVLPTVQALKLGSDPVKLQAFPNLKP